MKYTKIITPVVTLILVCIIYSTLMFYNIKSIHLTIFFIFVAIFYLLFSNNKYKTIKGKIIGYEFRKDFTDNSNDYNIIITAEFKINNKIEQISIKTVRLSHPVVGEEITIVLNINNFNDSLEK